jgi:hypothetical protein
MIMIFMVGWLAVGSGRCGRGPGVGVADRVMVHTADGAAVTQVAQRYGVSR